MPKKAYAFEPRGAKRLMIQWERGWKNVTVSMDDAPIGTIATKKALQAGRIFQLPDGTELLVRLDTLPWEGEGLTVLLDDEHLRGSFTDPLNKVFAAANEITFVGLLIAMVGGLFAYMGSGYTVLAFGLVYFLLAFLVRRYPRAIFLWIALFPTAFLCLYFLAFWWVSYQRVLQHQASQSYSLWPFILLLIATNSIRRGISALQQKKRAEPPAPVRQAPCPDPRGGPVTAPTAAPGGVTHPPEASTVKSNPWLPWACGGLFIVSVLAVACLGVGLMLWGLSRPEPTVTALAAGRPTATRRAEPAAQVVAGLQATRTPHKTATSEITATPIPTPIPAPAFSGPLPALAAIIPGNIGRLSELTGIGVGAPGQLRFSEHGNRLAVGSSNGVGFYLRQGAAGLQYDRAGWIDLHAPLLDLALSPDGQTAAVALADGALELRSVPGGELLYSLGNDAGTTLSVLFIENGQTLASASDQGQVSLWNVAGGSLRLAQGLPVGGVTTLAFAPDGQTLASAAPDGTLTLWQVDGGVRLHTLKGHQGRVNGLAFSPDGQTLASASEDGTARLWRSAGGEWLHTLRGDLGGMRSVAFSPDGETLATAAYDGSNRYGSFCAEGRLELWAVADGSLIKQSGDAGRAEVNGVTFLPEGSAIALSFCYGEVSLRPLPDRGSSYWTNLGKPPDPALAAFSPDDQMLAVGSREPDGTSVVRLWEIPSLTLLRTLSHPNPNGVRSLSFSPDGQTLAVDYKGGPLCMWEVASGNLLRQIGEGEGPMGDYTFAPDWQTFTAAATQWVDLYQVSDGQRQLRLPFWSRITSRAAFSPDGQYVAVGSSDGMLQIGRPADETYLRRLETSGYLQAVMSVTYSPDGRFLGTGSANGTVRIWQAPAGGLLRTLQAGDGPVESVAFTPDGKLLAAGSLEGLIRVWQTSNGSLARTLEGNSGQIGTLLFSPDGRLLISCASDGTVRLWGVQE